MSFDSNSLDRLLSIQQEFYTSTPLSQQPMFENMTFFIIGGKEIPLKRQQLMNKKILEFGGQVEMNMNETVTHVINGAEKIPSTVYSFNAKILDPSWFTKCLNEKKIVKDIVSIRKREKEEVSEELPVKKEITKPPVNSTLSYLACQVKYDESFNHNKELCDELEKFEKIYLTIREPMRSLAVRKARGVIAKLDHKITHVDDLVDKKGLGEKMTKSVQQFLDFGKIERLEGLEGNDLIQVIKRFQRIHGVGPKCAQQWWSDGLRTYDDLKKVTLTHAQTVSLKYLEETSQRIPREVIQRIEKMILDALISEPTLKMTICGSYRRGAPNSGDIDVLICDLREASDTLMNVVNLFCKIGLLVDHLSTPRDGGDSYFGICCFEGKHHRLDIKVYTRKDFHFALMHFTGSDYFNRSIKYHAKKLGYSLGDRSLRKVIREKGQVVYEGDDIICESEEEIFKALGLEYRDPTQRNV